MKLTLSSTIIYLKNHRWVTTISTYENVDEERSSNTNYLMASSSLNTYFNC
jgi:hypothetical protein